MINKKNIRDYEVSIWTLQDSFITILKPSHLENKGMIQDPKMVLKDDGENSFSFKIPMYIYEDTNLEEEPYFKKEELLIENPIWFNVRNGNLLVDMRKIKVIFNKKTEDEEIFEFIITNIKESHEGFSKYCEVTCGGLAFHELGKQGYTITLLHEDFNYDYEQWLFKKLEKESKSIENESETELEPIENELETEPGPEPIENIEYWIKKVLENSNWTYEIQMDWSLYNSTWDKTKIYKEPYVSSWKIKDNILIPEESVVDEDKLENLQAVEAKESNRYNLLQKIAETFQVFCKYKYEYDDNYHIIGRKVIFYNNFLSDKEEVIDFTYGYNTSQITREIDSMDLVTKMFVKPMKDSGTFSGEIKLSDSAANQSLEEYLLNFDYLYKIGTITKDQYEEVKNYQKELYRINSGILSNKRQLVYYENQLPLEEAKIANAESLDENCNRIINKAISEMREIANGKSSCSYTYTNPLPFILIKPTGDESNPYITLQSVFGELIQPSFQLYTEILPTGEVEKESEIKNNFEFTIKNGLVTKITIKNANLNDVARVYATFEYKPNISSQKIQQLWGSKQKQAQEDLKEAEEQLGIINEKIDEFNSENKDYLNEKQELINNFERFMGPAIREGTWNPEDSYSNCQTNEIFELDYSSLIKKSSTDRNNSVGFIWDNTLFEGEYKISYPYGLKTEDRYYPCINLDGIEGINSSNITNLNLVYRDYYWGLKDNDSKDYQDPTKNHYLALGAEDELKLVFLRDKIHKTQDDKKEIIIPALIVLGVRSLLDEEDDNGKSTTPYSQVQKNARLSTISYESNGDFIETVVIGEDSLKNRWIEHIEDYEIVYPRFYNSSLKFLTTTPENMIYYGDTALEKDKDYYMLFRADKEGILAHYLTLKPESLIFKLDGKYSFHYSLSTAADAIYLDALKILKENSTPKVSYSLTPLAKDESFIKKAYNRIGQLVHINDIDLKFENVQGYISEVNLSLDKPWEDNYTVKNYKTKFEDLFSTIVAQTQAMQRNSQTFTMASNLFDNNGYINSDLLNKSINQAEFKIDAFETVAVTEEAMMARIEEQLYKVTSDAALILNGNIGLAFPATDSIDGISLNNEVGLRIDGTMKRVSRDKDGEPELNQDGSYRYTDENPVKSYFRVTNGAMGFFKKGSENEKDEGMMYFDALTGDMALKGTLWAKAGGFGVVLDEHDKPSEGWLIETGVFKSLNGKATFTSGGLNDSPKITLTDNQDQEIFKFDNGNLTIAGTIKAADGNIAGWTIGKKALYKEDDKGNEVVGMGPGDSSSDISFWAGGSANEAPFRVTNGGALTATKANITGAITATSGTIGQTKAPKINIGSTSNASTSPSWIYSGSKSAKTSNNTGFYLGTDGLALGGTTTINNTTVSKFQVNTDGTLYATGATISGALTATSGSFTGTVTVGNNGCFTTNSSRTSYNSNNVNGVTMSSGGIGGRNGNNYFTLDTDGKITANNVNITGGDLNINNGKFHVSSDGTLTATGANISGIITASSGSIGPWGLDANGLWIWQDGVLSGMFTQHWNSGDPSGSANNPLDNYFFMAGTGAFKVTYGGALTATKANISGSFSAQVTGTQAAEVGINVYKSLKIEDNTYEAFMPFYIQQGTTSLFFWDGYLEMDQGKLSSVIGPDFISAERFTSGNCEFSGNRFFVENGIGIQMIAGSDNVGIGTYETNTWIIYKNKENGNVYIEGNVYVRNGPNNWKKISS